MILSQGLSPVNRGVGGFPRSFQVQRQQPRQDFIIGQVNRPAVRGEHRRVQRAVRQVEPRFLLCEALCQAQLR